MEFVSSVGWAYETSFGSMKLVMQFQELAIGRIWIHFALGCNELLCIDLLFPFHNFTFDIHIDCAGLISQLQEANASPTEYSSVYE